MVTVSMAFFTDVVHVCHYIGPLCENFGFIYLEDYHLYSTVPIGPCMYKSQFCPL